LLSSEKKSFWRFLTIYILLISLVIVSVSIIYYRINSVKIELQYKSLMQELSVLQIKRLKWLHNHFPKYNRYPRDERFNSAIYDLEYKEIFSTLKSKKIDFNTTFYFTKNYAIFVSILSDYYLGAKYLFIEIPQNSELLNGVLRNIVIYGGIAFILLILFGIYLAKLFIRPMQKSIELLDNFIKDTTHEINTPISIINTNIELLRSSNICKREEKKIKRVEIASRTLEMIYKDLKLSVLTSESEGREEFCNLKEIVTERLEYFALHIESKKLHLKVNLEDVEFKADPILIERLIDNLLSNAIKYNRVGGEIRVELTQEYLFVEDSGIGIEKSNIDKIFERYRRFNKSEGGFGIGLSIVDKVAKKYGYSVEVSSQKGKGTKVKVIWSKYS